MVKKVLTISSTIILIESVFRTGINFYFEVFLEDCKYVVKEKKIPKYITDDLEIFSDSDRKNSVEQIFIFYF